MDFTIYFDNGGNATLQTAEYCHSYDDGVRLAEDVRELIKTGTTADWDGNQPECRIDGDNWREVDGEVWTAENVRQALDGREFESKGQTENDFVAALQGQEVGNG